MSQILKPLTDLTKAAKGSYPLPGGLLLQWGTETITANQGTTQGLTTFLGGWKLHIPEGIFCGSIHNRRQP